MKKYITIGSLCATLFFAGCDNYLDIVPKGQSVLNSTSDYIGLLEEGDPCFEMNTFYYMADEASMRDMNDIETYKYPLSSIAFFWDETADRIKHTVTEADDAIYAHCYRRISRYNIIIENIGDADGSEADKKLGIAQAKILRAYNYFFLVNTYAKQYDPATAATDPGIIIHEKFDLEATSRQYTVQQVYDFIERDIKDALPDLPEEPVNSFRPSQAFGYGLKAKVLLFKGDIDGALTAGLEVLKSSYHHLWDINEAYNTINTAYQAAYQAMYEVYKAAGIPEFMIPAMIEQGGVTFANNRFNAPHSAKEPDHLLYQMGLNQFDPVPTFVRKHVVDLYDKQADLRYLLCYGGAPVQPNAEKGAEPFMNSFIAWNCGGMRLSEVYLMIAECYARQNNAGKAMEYLNMLREKRTLKAKYKEWSTDDAAVAFKWVREERKRELVLTCNGFFDMRRYASQLNETQTKEYTTIGGEVKSYTLSPDSPLMIYPFPQNATETADLTQNTK